MPPTTSLDSTVRSLPTLSSIPMTSVPDQPPLETLPELFVAADQPHNGRRVNNRVFNYYFLCLALLTGILAALFWWLHHQRRREREQIRLRGSNASTQDVEHWTLNRCNQLSAIEGLNEAGEAPPPYKSKDDTVTTQDPANGHDKLSASVMRPPRALSQNQREHGRLPESLETVRIDCNLGIELARPATQFVAPRPGGGAT